jgi:acyl carrier protein
VPAGEVGEICVKSRYISLGYWRDPERTKAVFRPDPVGGGAQIYRTGDLGVRAENGCFTHVGRCDFQVKIRGFRIETSEIEVALRAIEGVRDAVVVGRENRLGEKRLVAYFVPATTPAITVTEIRNSLAQAIPEYMIPTGFVCIDKIPQTPNGKTDRLRLPPSTRERPQLDVSFAPPTTDVERELSRIWSDVLDLEEVGIHDNFFELGGDSLMATRTAARVLKEFGVELQLRVLFESPTVAEVAQVVTESRMKPIGDEELAAMLDQLESPSDEERRR